MDTPVLIPNTEVKHISGDNIWTGSSEDSTLPGNLTHLTMGLFCLEFLCCYKYRVSGMHSIPVMIIHDVKSDG